MIQEIAYPPNIDRIRQRFGNRVMTGKVIFAWGDTIYNPGDIDLSDMLREHEGVHGERQGDDPEGWWEQYLTNDKFVLEEELLAHTVEYIYLLRVAKSRAMRRNALKQSAKRLASPLYGRLITFESAKKQIKAMSQPQD